jgi:hypothetical protein
VIDLQISHQRRLTWFKEHRDGLARHPIKPNSNKYYFPLHLQSLALLPNHISKLEVEIDNAVAKRAWKEADRLEDILNGLKVSCYE